MNDDLADLISRALNHVALQARASDRKRLAKEHADVLTARCEGQRDIVRELVRLLNKETERCSRLEDQLAKAAA